MTPQRLFTEARRRKAPNSAPDEGARRMARAARSSSSSRSIQIPEIPTLP